MLQQEQYDVHYTVTPCPNPHLFRVRLELQRPAAEGQRLSLPAWIPGSYMIRDFARHIVRLSASSAGQPVAVEKLDKQTWHCAPCEGPLTVEYEVYAWDLSVRGAHLDPTHGYFNGTSLFLRVHGQDQAPCTVDLEPPAEGAPYKEWKVATTLPPAGAQRHGFGRFRAADYDELIDHPVEMGTFTLLEFEACGIPHEVALTGRFHADLARIARDLQRICEHHIRFFGEPAPMDRYLFQMMVVGDGYGGLEHRSSTSLICRRDDLPVVGDERVSDGYRSFLGLCSHEYFHTWNVKRIKPAVFQPYDLEQEVHTPLLWAFEGITSYYDDLALVRSGLIERDSYLELLGRNLTRVERGAGRHKQSVAESSFDAWTKFYKQDENAPNAIVSYYVKGALVALLLDLHIRRETGGARSLDDVMRALWARHAEVGVTDAGLEALFDEVTGLQLKPLFDLAVRGTEPLPLAPLLEWMGIEMGARAAESQGDQGGKTGSGKGPELPWLGIRTQSDPAGARVTVVLEGSPAQQAGIAPGDLVIAIGGLRAAHDAIDRLLGRLQPGDQVGVHLFRRDELLHVEPTLAPAPRDTCWLALPEAPDSEAAERLDSWLGPR